MCGLTTVYVLLLQRKCYVFVYIVFEYQVVWDTLHVLYM